MISSFNLSRVSMFLAHQARFGLVMASPSTVVLFVVRVLNVHAILLRFRLLTFTRTTMRRQPLIIRNDFRS